jgi:hypothetical protein
MEASATSPADLSDVLLASHFAFRAIPDFKHNTCATYAGVSLKECGGWLCIASDSQRSLG